VIFLDRDDLWEPDTLETLSGILCNHTEYISMHSLCRCIDSYGRPVEGDDIQIVLSARNGYRGGAVRPLRADEPSTFADLALFNWICTPGLHLTVTRLILPSDLRLVMEVTAAGLRPRR
jgi:hypothetical protein